MNGTAWSRFPIYLLSGICRLAICESDFPKLNVQLPRVLPLTGTRPNESLIPTALMAPSPCGIVSLTEHSGKSVADSEEGSGSEEDEEDQADLGKRRGPSFFFFFCFECCVPLRQPLHLPSAFVQKPTRRGMRRMKVSWVTPSLSLYGVLMPQ